MKIHFQVKTYKTGESITHFKTKCGEIRHVFTNLPHSLILNEVTCKKCLKYNNGSNNNTKK